MYRTNHLPGEAEVLTHDLQWTTFYNYYSQVSDAGVSETWTQAVARATDNLRTLSNNLLSDEQYQEMFDSIYKQEVLPSMRLFSMPSAAIQRCNTVIYNCAFLSIDTFTSVSEIMYLTMSGVGCGYTVERKVIDNLPAIPYLVMDSAPFIVEDSQVGWANSVTFLFEAILSNIIPVFDYSEVRPAGARLNTKGGYASGPEPLKLYHDLVIEILKKAQGGRLTSINVHDIVNMISECAVSNGSRSGALICLFDDDDVAMLNAKSDPDWYNKTPWRSYSNNSVVVNGTTHEFIDDIVGSLIGNEMGEPGLFSRETFRKSGRVANEGEHIIGTNPCVTGDTLVAVADGRVPQTMLSLVNDNKDVDVYTVYNSELTIRTMRDFRKTGTDVPIYRVNFSDGSYEDVTANHKFILKDGTKVEAVNLTHEHEIDSMTISGYTKGRKHFETCAIDNAYRHLFYGQFNKSEHRFMVRHHTGENIVGVHDKQVHHKDYIPSNNNINNLTIISHKDHVALHRDRMIGDNNPMRQLHSAEWWQRYHDNMSKAVLGELNGRYSGYTNVELLNIVIQETLEKGTQLTNSEWSRLGNTYPNFPKQLGGKFRNITVGALLRQAANYCNISYVDNQTYSNLEVSVTKHCECCGRVVRYHKNLKGIRFCSKMCKEHTDGGLRTAQLKAYNDLVIELNRHPFSYEFSNRCKERNIFVEYGTPFSLYKSYSALTAEAQVYNHRIVSVDYIGTDDVFTGTVDDTHTFFGSGALVKDSKGNTRFSGTLQAQCGEVNLRSGLKTSKSNGYGQFCNLSTVVLQPQSFKNNHINTQLRIATLIGTIQASATKFRFLRKGWSENCQDEALLGVCITGIYDYKDEFNSTSLNDFRQLVQSCNVKYAKQLGINVATATTSVKPSGNTSVLTNTSPGVNPDFGKYQIRNVRIGVHSKMARFLLANNIPLIDDPAQSTNAKYIASFPRECNSKNTLEAATVRDQIDNYLLWETYYVTHSVSVTITYSEHEKEWLATWIKDNYETTSGMTFFPNDTTKYPYKPIEVVSREEFEAYQKYNIDWTSYATFTEGDATLLKAAECSGERCDIVW